MTWHVFALVLVLGRAFAAPPIAKSSCIDQCGGVDIPYPFGIGPGCSIGEWFEIICANNTVPLLSLTNQNVTNISIENGTITVKNPITFFECGTQNEGRQSPSLEGSPFYYSQSRNTFTSVSCGWIAQMTNSSDSIVGGCLCICSSNNTKDGNRDYCQTTISVNLQGFNTSIIDAHPTPSLKPRAPRVIECNYAFLVDRHWFSSNVSDVYALRGETDVPVVLEWELYNTTEQVFGAFVKTLNSSEISGYVMNSSCNKSTSLLNKSLPTLACFCPKGFEGNPYLLQSCYDVNECKIKGYCEPNFMCINYAGGYRCKRSPPKMIFIGIGSGFLSLLLLVGAWLLYRAIKKKQNIQRKRMIFKQNGGLLLQQEISSTKENSHVEKTKLFSSKELDKATNKFNADRILGQGGQGTVYKGMLADGKIVAVKKSKLENKGQVVQFINEVVILSQINHRNVVKLLGCCLETEVPLLVYEFVPNGTLSKYIHDENEEFPLTWEIRLRIATEVAGALSYLHNSASVPIFHRDIKSTNILLDDKYRAKIADFGTSRSISIDKSHLTTLVCGTFGYLDPEYFQSSQFTDKSDVYSFGVVLVELLSGQKPISVPTTSDQARGLAIYFNQCMEENRLFDIVDPRVVKEGEKVAIIAFANVAKQCLYLNGRRRPTMKEVANFLEDIERTLKPSDVQADIEVAEYVKGETELNSASCSSSAWSSTYGTETFPPSKRISILSRKSK